MQNNRNNRKVSKRVDGSTVAKDDKIITLLRRLVQLNEAETLRMIPGTPDVPRIIIRKDRIYTASFQQTFAPVTVNSTAESNFSMSFALSNADGYTPWTQCFDSYRIIQVVVEFISFGITPTANATLGTFTTAIDYDDATAVTSTVLTQYDTCMQVPSGQFFERRLRPRCAKALYSGAFTSYGQDESTWIDTSSPTVQYYGIKASASVSSSANTIYRPLITYYVQFRNNS